MATIQSSLVFQDKMSSAIASVSNALESASINAKFAKMDLDELEYAQKEWKTTLDAANSSAVKNQENIKKAEQEYKKATQAVDKATLQYLKYEDQIIKNTNKLKQLQEQQGNVNLKIIAFASAMQIYNQVAGMLRGVNSKIDEYIRYTEAQMQAEDKLAIIAKARMNLNDEQVKSLYGLASAQQKIGVIGDEVAITGMSNMASFIKQKESIEALVPAMNNLIAKNKGYHATVGDAQMVSRALSMAMQGNVGMMTRLGVVINDTTKKRLMALSEEERAVELAKLVTATTGNLNEEMAKTPLGKIAQANNRLGDSYEKLGAVLLPLKAATAEFWSGTIEAVVNNLDTIVPLVLAGLTTLGVAFVTLKWEAIQAAVASASAWIAATAPFWIIVGVLGLVSVALNALGLSFQEQAENIIISFNWVVTAIKNTGIAVANLGRAMYNGFFNAIEGIKKMFFSFINWYLGMLGNVAKAIDAVFKTNVSSVIDGMQDKVNILQNKMTPHERKKYTEFLDNDIWTNQAKAQVTMSKLSGGSLTDRVLAGTGGAGIDSELLTSAGGGKALKTQNQGKIEIKEEDMKLLHDIATRDYMVNYQQLTPQVTLQGLTINEMVDANQVIDMIVDGVAEAAESKLQVAT